MRRVAFRTEGSAGVGIGHVRRCLALAQALRGMGSESVFLIDGDQRLFEQVAAEGFKAIGIHSDCDPGETIEQCDAEGAGAVVVDSYAVGTADFEKLMATGRAVVVIDDLADRELPVTLVVNGAAGAERLRYRGAPETRYLLGPRYIALRSEFAETPARLIANGVRRVLITVGGGDPFVLTPRLIQWTAKTLGDVEQDVVIGPFFEAFRIEANSAGKIHLHENSREMSRLMLAADLALCGGGQTTYELAATGTPAIAIRVAENQTVNLKGLSEAGALVWAGDAQDADLQERVASALAQLAADAKQRAEMSRRDRALVDGQGATRVARAILEMAGES